MVRIPHKRGDTFDKEATYTIDGQPVDLTNYDIAAMARKMLGGDWVGVFSIVKNPDQVTYKGKYRLVVSATDMRAWPVGELICDIEYTLAGFVQSTETFIIPLAPDVTHP